MPQHKEVAGLMENDCRLYSKIGNIPSLTFVPNIPLLTKQMLQIMESFYGIGLCLCFISLPPLNMEKVANYLE